MGLEYLWRVFRSHSVIKSSVCLAHETLEPASHSIYPVSKLYNGIGMVLASLCNIQERKKRMLKGKGKSSSSNSKDDCDGDGFVNPCFDPTRPIFLDDGTAQCVSDARGDSCVRDEARRQFLAEPIS
eukprot:scaffold81439_cov54-Attheya_sp.AAC.1